MPTAELALASPALVSAVIDATSQAARLWATLWGIDPALLEVSELAGPFANPASQLHLREASADIAARLWWPKEVAGEIAHLLYGTPPGRAPDAGSLARESVGHVEAELRRLLSQAWMVQGWDEQTASSTFNPPGRWHAPVGIEISIGHATLQACVPAARFRKSKRRGPMQVLTPPQAQAAFARSTTHLTALLGSADVTVADLASLQPGDVLVLDQRTVDPLQVTVQGGALTLPASLGRQGNSRALQILPSSSRQS